ncbi:MAG: alpha/beta fold hydrolase [Clostridia bacterium]|nr:alpha/beta fold hydrolase [Clostridia bacterium]
MSKTVEFVFNGFPATVILPEKPNGKWIWKTEFLYAFDQAERALLDEGYTRVYYGISDKYGSYNAVRLMRKFYHFVIKEYNLDEKAILFGFSRGGLYAFNFALFYPEYVSKVYLDAPVLDMKSWPPADSTERQEVYAEYGLNPETIQTFKGNPIDNLEEFFSLNIPLLVVAGGSDEVVAYEENSGKLIDYCNQNGIKIEATVKPECLHHPHSLEDVSSIVAFVNKEN